MLYNAKFAEFKLLLGITSKKCPDIRNTKIVDVVAALQDYGLEVTIYDPWANPEEVQHEYGLQSLQDKPTNKFDAVVLGVAHNEFLDLDFERLRKGKSVLYDVKGVLEVNNVDGKL